MISLSAAVALVAFAVFHAACKSDGRAEPQQPGMSQCLAELRTIPEVAYLTSRDKDPSDQERPFDGLELALTINGMIQSQSDQEPDEDDWCYQENNRDNFDKMIGALRENDMSPTLSFVSGRRSTTALVEEWGRSGNLIGNLTYDELKLKKRTVQEFVENAVRNDLALAPSLKKVKQKRKYFRFPALKAGRRATEREQVKALLKQKGYLFVPITLDTRDQEFGQLYCAALARGDQVCANLVRAYYFSLLLDSTLKAREAAKAATGRDIRHILRLRAGQFAADNLSEIIKWYRGLGATFVPIDVALADSFYSREDADRAASNIVRKIRRNQRRTD